MLFLLLAISQSYTSPLQPLVDAFRQQDIRYFEPFLDEAQSVQLDLRPLLPDQGIVSSAQIALSFKRLVHLFKITNAKLINQSGDTNYSRLECVLLLHLTDRKGTSFKAAFDLRFHLTSHSLGLSHWALSRIE